MALQPKRQTSTLFSKRLMIHTSNILEVWKLPGHCGVCVCVCVCARACACMHVCMCVCARAHMHVCVNTVVICVYTAEL
jgi:hypothetical protein